MEKLQHLLIGLGTTDILEQLAVFCALLYVILISFKSQWGWLFATISSTIYVFICYFGKLYLETGLQGFYIAVAIYGWYEWSDAEGEENAGCRQWSLKQHVYLISGTMALTLISGLIFDMYTDQANPFLDAFTTMFSLVTTYMVTKKVLENWLYWIVIDLVAMVLYMKRGFELTAILYLLYSVIAVFGYFNWKRGFKRI